MSGCKVNMKEMFLATFTDSNFDPQNFQILCQKLPMTPNKKSWCTSGKLICTRFFSSAGLEKKYFETLRPTASQCKKYLPRKAELIGRLAHMEFQKKKKILTTFFKAPTSHSKFSLV